MKEEPSDPFFLRAINSKSNQKSKNNVSKVLAAR
jgi:hypothetical protein